MTLKLFWHDFGFILEWVWGLKKASKKKPNLERFWNDFGTIFEAPEPLKMRFRMGGLRYFWVSVFKDVLGRFLGRFWSLLGTILGSLESVWGLKKVSKTKPILGLRGSPEDWAAQRTKLWDHPLFGPRNSIFGVSKWSTRLQVGLGTIFVKILELSWHGFGFILESLRGLKKVSKKKTILGRFWACRAWHRKSGFFASWGCIQETVGTFLECPDGPEFAQ